MLFAYRIGESRRKNLPREVHDEFHDEFCDELDEAGRNMDVGAMTRRALR